MRAMDQIQVKTHQIYLRISPGPRGAIRGDDLGKLWEDFFAYGAREYQMVADWTTEIRAAILKGERPAPVTIEAFLKRTGFEVFYNEDGYVSRVRWTYPSGVTQTRTASKIRRGIEAAFLEDAPRGTLPRDVFRRSWFERVEVPRQAAEAVQGTVERRGSLELRAIRDKWKRGETLTQAEVQKIFDLARDPVTGLRNRAWWEMAVFQTSDDLPVKAIIDLNYLKHFNDSGGAGHANGDKLLKALAEAIQQVAPGESQAMRVGGDEFLLLFPDQATADTALARLRELTSDVPFKWDEVVQGIPTGQRVNVRGIHFEVGTGATFDEADQAMQLAKEARPPTRGQPPPGLTREARAGVPAHLRTVNATGAGVRTRAAWWNKVKTAFLMTDGDLEAAQAVVDAAAATWKAQHGTDWYETMLDQVKSVRAAAEIPGTARLATLMTGDIVFPASSPPVGATRLYRGHVVPTGMEKPLPEWLVQARQAAGLPLVEGRWFTDDLSIAKWYQNEAGERGTISYVDIPNDQLEAWRVSNVPEAARFSRDPQREFFIPRNLAGQSKPYLETGAIPAIERGGGLTYNPFTGEVVNPITHQGYVVAVSPRFERIVPGETFFAALEAQHEAEALYVLQHWDELQVDNRWLGIYHSVDGDQVYFDISEIVADREAATYYGIQRNQESAYDLQAGDLVYFDTERGRAAAAARGHSVAALAPGQAEELARKFGRPPGPVGLAEGERWADQPSVLKYHSLPQLRAQAEFVSPRWGYDIDPDVIVDDTLHYFKTGELPFEGDFRPADIRSETERLAYQRTFAAQETARRYAETWADTLLPAAGHGIQSEVAPGHVLLYRTARSAQEVDTVLSALEDGRALGDGFRASVAHEIGRA